MLRAMPDVRTVAAIRVAMSTRRDLLLEILALRHQVAVLARSNQCFRRSDRLLWLMLRRLWPRWREALVLVRPATVDRWHRDWFRRRWWHRSRRPGRPRIDPECRDLIGRMAEENRLWGAPRIHGELLKIGIVVSEHTVSRYLAERPKRPSQTWRTFLANHFGQLTFMSQTLSSHASDAAIDDAFATTCGPAPSSDNVAASRRCALAAWSASVRRIGVEVSGPQDHLRDRTGVQRSTGRAPPRLRFAQLADGAHAESRCGAIAADQLRGLAARDRSFRDRASVIRPRHVFVWSAMPGHSYTVGIMARHTSRSVVSVPFSKPRAMVLWIARSWLQAASA
jgi:hypothetical protein